MEFYLLQGLGLGLGVAIAPGPLQAYLLAQTVRHGPRHALPLILAPVVSDVPIIALVLLALSVLPEVALRGLLITGGLVLLYLAIESLHQLRHPHPSEPPTGKEAGENFFKAVLLNALSPGPYIFWGTIAGPIFNRGYALDPLYGWLYLGGFFAGLVGGLAAYILTAGATRKLNPTGQRWVNIATTIILFGFGLYQIWSGVFASTTDAFAK